MPDSRYYEEKVRSGTACAGPGASVNLPEQLS